MEIDLGWAIALGVISAISIGVNIGNMFEYVFKVEKRVAKLEKKCQTKK